MTQALSLDPKNTALVLIDLQHGIVGRELAPYSGSQVVENAVRLAEATRAAGGTVVFVRVLLTELLQRITDAAPQASNAPPPPAIASELVPEAGVQAGDLVVTKRQWGAFYGTDLEQQLRRRGIRTIVMAGIATHIGVESTARAAFDQGYDLVFIEDAMSTMSAEAHQNCVNGVFRLMGHVRSTQEYVEALGRAV
ncbi:isochorismatase family protein [Paraburkholderia saeva]|uniref:isochorismatase family protein n=1 Tax=Paraburkholderia saeva TaxID=2777537 RepID=UPI001D8507F1|nr:isochorismatase family protein [Paraburkholderia saeva]CAG4915680.1 Isochorismatase family protein YecD [Paraburkholderia saeva]